MWTFVSTAPIPYTLRACCSLQLREENTTGLQQYKLLAELAARNQTLFFYVVTNNLDELAPIIYTPVVGEACQKFDRIYRCGAPCRAVPNPKP